MTKKKSTLKKQPAAPASIPATGIKPFGHTFILKNTVLTPESEFPDDAGFHLLPPVSRENCSAIVFTNRVCFFGEHTIGFGMQGKEEYPFDALMFDFSDTGKPRLYLLILSTELTVTMLSLIKLNAYLASKPNRETLIEKLTAVSSKDKSFVKSFGTYITGEQTLASVLEATVRKGLRGLCLFNTGDQQDAEIVTSYMGAHGGYIDVIFLRLYKMEKQTILSMVPSFNELKAEAPKPPKEKVIHTEEDHLVQASELSRSIYIKLKTEALKLDKSLVVNPKGKHYISLRREGIKNLAFFHFRRGSIYLVVMLPESQVKKLVKKSEVKSLPMSVQAFWNGASTGLVITSTDYLKEIVEVFKKLIKQ